MWCHSHLWAASQHLREECWLEVQLAALPISYSWSQEFSLLLPSPLCLSFSFISALCIKGNDKKQTGHLDAVCLCTATATWLLHSHVLPPSSESAHDHIRHNSVHASSVCRRSNVNLFCSDSCITKSISRHSNQNQFISIESLQSLDLLVEAKSSQSFHIKFPHVDRLWNILTIPQNLKVQNAGSDYISCHTIKFYTTFFRVKHFWKYQYVTMLPEPPISWPCTISPCHSALWSLFWSAVNTKLFLLLTDATSSLCQSAQTNRAGWESDKVTA